MKKISWIFSVCAGCMITACQQAPSTSSGETHMANEQTTGEWVNNGGTACKKYLTPEIIGAIFKHADGQSQTQDSQACTFAAAHEANTDYSTINIYLRSGGDLVFDSDPITRNGSAIRGVGDKAVRTQEDGVQAVKGDRICSIYVKPPFGNELKGEAMAQKLGEVCNALFALP